LEEALVLLSEHGGEAKPLAGGQSLVPSMNFRLAQPSILVDLNRITDLAGIVEEGDTLSIRAMTRQRAVERDSFVAARAPLISEAIPHIAHPQIRNRGTFGGSLAHADPASELPAVAVALDATMQISNVGGRRALPAADFFFGLFTTALEPDELLVQVDFPRLPNRTGTAFEEFARRHGDYALAGACALVTLSENGTIGDARVVLFAVGEMPVQSQSAVDILLGQTPTPEVIHAAADSIDADIDPQSDIHATSDYRRHLAKVLVRRVLARAVARSQPEGGTA
jgi:carbon-monoxide dehydrogenase medium subunit